MTSITMFRVKEKVFKLLVDTQKYTQLDHIYLAKSGFWISAFNVLSIGLGIVTTIIFTRFSNKITYGYYQYIIAAVSTIWILSLPGINTAIIKSVAKGNNGSLLLGLRHKLRFSLWGTLVLTASAAFFLYFKHDSLFAKLFLVAAIFYPVHTSFSCLFSFFIAKKRFRELTIWQSISRIWGVITLALAILLVKNIFWIILVYFVASSIFNLVLYFWLLKKEVLSGESESSVISYGRELTLSNVLPQLLGNFDRMVLPVFLGVEALAVYTVAVKIPDTIKGFSSSFDSVFIPKFVDKQGGVLLKKIQNIWIILVFILGVVICALIMPWAMRFLFGRGYENAIIVSQVYLLMLIPYFVRRLLNNWMVANTQSGMYFKNQTLYVLFSTVLIFLGLVIYPSLMSVVVAKVVAVIVAAIHGIWAVKKTERQSV